MAHRVLSLLFIVGLFFGIGSARAAEPVSALPEVKAPTSGRFDFALAINQQVLGYGKGEFTGTAVHAVFVDAQQDQLIELVLVGDQLFLREGVEPRWLGTRLDVQDVPIAGPATPTLPDEGLAITNVGTAEVGGVPTTQYQISIDPAQLAAVSGAETGALPNTTGLNEAKVDLFIGANDTFLRKVQLTAQVPDPQLGNVTLEAVLVFSALNEPVVVGPPPANLVDQLPVQAASRYGFAGAQLVPAWTRPVFGEGLARLRSSR